MAANKVSDKGTVASVVFRNDETGYTVLVLELVDGGKVTCVGSFANLSVGAVLSVSGHKVNHRQYGEQIVADNYTMCNPTSEEGIVRYLSSGLIKGVGAVTAQNIYDMFGDDTFGVIENNPMLLSRVRGISKKKAMEIANAVSELKCMQEQIMFLQGYGMTVNLAMKIYNNYGADTKRLVLANPYRLVDDIDGDAAEDKQFIIAKSKGGNYFYIIVDRAAEGENSVHFLNQVDESDLMAIIGEEQTEQPPSVCNCTEKCKAGEVNTACPVCSVNMDSCTGKEAAPEEPTEQEQPQNGMGGLLIFLVVGLLGGGAALYYFKFMKPKQSVKGSTDLDEFDFDEYDEDEPEEETDIADTEQEDEEE